MADTQEQAQAATNDPDSQITILLDGDTLAYRVAAGVQHTQTDIHGFVQPFANVQEGEVTLDNMIMGLMTSLKAIGMQIYLSDPEASWRKELWPAYKANRKDIFRPLLLGRLKEYLKSHYGATYWPGLEADDVLGILATRSQDWPGKTVVVGKDKDFMTIPGWHYQLGDNGPGGEPIIREVKEPFADWWHLVQALGGDKIDGYAGCPGIGTTRAKRILDDGKMFYPDRSVITRGPRKGVETTAWKTKDAEGDLWGVVISCYESKGLTEKDALLNARLAHILRDGDYDIKTGKITLWVPPDRIRMRQS